MNNIEVPQDERKSPEPKTLVDPIDPVQIKTVEVEVPVEVTKVATSLTIGQKMHIEKCFKALRSEVETGLNGGLENLRLRVLKAFNDEFARSRAWQKSIDDNTAKLVKQIDQKFSGMYRTLIHEFLVRLERRIMNAELYTRALIDQTAETVTRHEQNHATVYQAVLSLEARMNALVKATSELARDPQAFTKAIEDASHAPKVDPEVTIESWKNAYNDRVDAEAKAFSERAEKVQLAPQPEEQKAAAEQSPQEETKDNVAVQTENEAPKSVS